MAILSDDPTRILSAAAVLQTQGTRFRFIKAPYDLQQIACACCDNIEVALIEDPLSAAQIKELLRQSPPAAICPFRHTVVLLKKADATMHEEVRAAGGTLIKETLQDATPLRDVLRANAYRPSPTLTSPRTKRSEFGMLMSGVFEFQTLEEAEKLSILLTENTPEPEKVRIGIWELLSNAVEHGNLGIIFEEKNRLLETGRFHQEVTRRLQLKRYRDRVARMTISAGHDSIHLQVRDDGLGFDFHKFLEGELQPERPNERGIRLVCGMCFDRLSYIGSGNTVEATVFFCEGPEADLQDASSTGTGNRG
ncbi:ATP-binding protein [Breoghania sp.]|uniref:ATP-binding protein n=1 Tax=Breoghania sp. TaxID=2065378 RepID=UPI00262F9255|nr:ATP-binding protein [Breoghania sp.]MDJ0933039.1 ATP-binding protein [Breoghania sp.]